jgi:hypothetical protein
MMPYTESGITVHFPDANYFHFGACAAYKTLSGASVKEMDVCWLEKSTNTLWAVELKAFDDPANARHTQQDLSQSGIVDYWMDELLKKSIHTLCMLETNRSKTKTCLVAGISDLTDFKLVHLINVIPGQESFLMFMKDKLQALLKPYLAVFRVSSIAIIPYSTARNRRLLPWIV